MFYKQRLVIYAGFRQNFAENFSLFGSLRPGHIVHFIFYDWNSMPSRKIIISKIIKFQNRGAVKYALLRRRNVFARYVYKRLNGTRKFYTSVTVVHITLKKKYSTSQGPSLQLNK